MAENEESPREERSAGAKSEPDRGRPQPGRSGGPRPGAVIAVAIAVAFVVWLVAIRDGDDEAAEPQQASAEPVVMTEEELASLSAELGHPIYWAGPQEGAELEVTQAEEGQVSVRYLTEGAEVGAADGEFLVVGTYRVTDAQAALDGAAEQKGALRGETPDGKVVVTNESSPSNVYLADSENNLQVEIYDPDPERAFELATGGEIVPVG